MTIEQAIRLINCPGISVTHPTTWADFGAGAGVFTTALSNLLFPGSRIMAVDQDSASLRKIKIPSTVMLDRKVEDFTRIELPQHSLHGLLLANALHFVKDKAAFLKRASTFLAKTGALIIVEYDMSKANPWVPYPVSYATLEKLVNASLGINMEKIAEMPSVYNRGMIYGAYARIDDRWPE
jgi:ubiquinone/menaquinone biosynthesis C-methylase UbiE